MLRRAARIFAEDEIATEEGLRWGWVTTISTNVLWDVESWQSIAFRQVQSAREAGLLVHVLAYANLLGIFATRCGDFAAAASLIAEGDAIAEATGTRLAPYAAVFLAGLRGSEADATRRIEVVTKDARATGQGLGIQFCQLVSGILYNGLGRYEKAQPEARQASEQAPELYISAWALPELIEAASRTGQTQLAADALDRLAAATSVGQTDWAQGIHARSRALLSDGETAETSYREAIERLGRTPLRPELARAHLLYGEWLRREARRADARAQLRTAHDMLAAIGMEAFAERARRELAATGETARQRTVEAREQAHPPRGPDRPPGPRRPVEPGDRRPPVHQRAHRPVPPGQGLHQARDQLPPATPASTARRRQRRAAGKRAGHTESATLSWTSGVRASSSTWRSARQRARRRARQRTVPHRAALRSDQGNAHAAARRRRGCRHHPVLWHKRRH